MSGYLRPRESLMLLSFGQKQWAQFDLDKSRSDKGPRKQTRLDEFGKLFENRSMKLMALFLTVFAAQASFASINRKCEVKVTYHLRSGVIQEARVRTMAKTKADCHKQARTIKVYSAPKNSVRKVVAVDWKVIK
jgi:hypothetical protein